MKTATRAEARAFQHTKHTWLQMAATQKMLFNVRLSGCYIGNKRF